MSYTVLYNLLNCPAGVVPVTQTTANDIASLCYYRGHYDDPWDEVVKRVRRGNTKYTALKLGQLFIKMYQRTL